MNDLSALGLTISCFFLTIIMLALTTNDLYKIYHGYEHLRNRYVFFFVLFGILSILMFMGFVYFLNILI